MLILTRLVDQEIVIGDDIVIKILRIQRSYNVRIGIEAPKHIRVHRREIADRMIAERVKS